MDNSHTGDMKSGRVFKKALGQYFVKTDGRTVACSISSKLRKRLIYPVADASSIRPHVVSVKGIRTVDPIAVGDIVNFLDAGDGSGMITEVQHRETKLSRRAAGPKLREQVIVANIDQVVPVFSVARPKPKWRLLDRCLADAEATEVPVLICMTKMDLMKGEETEEELSVYEDIGYPVVRSSAITGLALEEVKEALKDRVSVFLGRSGVGKTTLLNAIQPGLDLRVEQVSEATGKGKHTTSHLEMFELDFGGSVVDTPGMRELGLWNIDDENMANLFREMRPYIGQCRFGLNCSHTHEPGCAVKEAVKAGEITERRYESYVHMRLARHLPT